MKKEFSKNCKIRFLYILPCFLIFSTSLIIATRNSAHLKEDAKVQKNRKLLEIVDGEEIECIRSGIYSFPQDFFTQEQRQKGGVLVHVMITLYVCSMIAIVCDRYFIPSLEIVSDKLNLPLDVAGATFMAIGGSSPELFSSILGSFVTEGDIGVGAVIGSAVFNILGITGVAGVYLWNEVIDVDWYPIARDSIAYGITVLCLTWIISDSKVFWWEATVLLGLFVLYIILMYFNRRVERCAKNLAESRNCSCCCSTSGEKSPLVNKHHISKGREEPKLDSTNIVVTETNKKEQLISQEKKLGSTTIIDNISMEMIDEEQPLCSPPPGPFSFIWWLIMLPASTVLFITIPNSKNPKFRKLFIITFVVSVMWLGVLSYLAVWMVTIIGYTLRIPDSVSGLTILAVGASVPDLVSSVLVAKSGEGNMAISNLVGSNTFDISICLGVPWLVKALLSDQGYLRLQSLALAYATATLFTTLLAFYLIFYFSRWKLNRSVGWICLVIYAAFVIFACLFEFNVFGDINLPSCYP